MPIQREPCERLVHSAVDDSFKRMGQCWHGILPSAVFFIFFSTKLACFEKFAGAAATRLSEQTQCPFWLAAWPFTQRVACVTPHSALQWPGRLTVVPSVAGKQRTLTVCWCISVITILGLVCRKMTKLLNKVCLAFSFFFFFPFSFQYELPAADAAMGNSITCGEKQQFSTWKAGNKCVSTL